MKLLCLSVELLSKISLLTIGISLYSSPNIVRVIKSRRMRWDGHVARMGRVEVFTGFLLGGPKARDHWEDLGVGGRITLRWT
jgi:hypothetical protein